MRNLEFGETARSVTRKFNPGRQMLSWPDPVEVLTDFSINAYRMVQSTSLQPAALNQLTLTTPSRTFPFPSWQVERRFLQVPSCLVLRANRS